MHPRAGSPSITFAIIAAIAVVACLGVLAMLQPAFGTDRSALVGTAPAPATPAVATAGASAPPSTTTETAPGTATDPGTTPEPGTTTDPGTTTPTPTEPTTPRVDGPPPNVLVDVPRTMRLRARPGGGAVVGTLPAASKYYGTPVRAWVERRSPDGAWGKVSIPWTAGTTRSGWVRIAGLPTTSTPISVRASVSRREITVLRAGKVLFRAKAAVGRPGSATPPGHYFVTDRVPLGRSAPNYGSYAFGLSGIQPHLPRGWRGGNQLAIHGTSNPASIGTRASAGCLRVSEDTLRRLRPLLRLGTPVIITP